jgi:hypothetical protein
MTGVDEGNKGNKNHKIILTSWQKWKKAQNIVSVMIVNWIYQITSPFKRSTFPQMFLDTVSVLD